MPHNQSQEVVENAVNRVNVAAVEIDIEDQRDTTGTGPQARGDINVADGAPNQVPANAHPEPEPNAEAADDGEEMQDSDDEAVDILLSGACDIKLQVRTEYRARIKQAAED